MAAETGGILALDVGGTTIDVAAIAPELILAGSMHTIVSDNSASRDGILRTLETAIAVAADESHMNNLTVEACGIAFPNPFDYVHGTSHMKHKFQAIRGVNLREWFAQRHDFPFFFLNDADAFGYGVLGKDYEIAPERLVAITLGTGVGSSYFTNGQLQELEVWDMPYGAGILEDSISSKALVRDYEKRTRQERSVKAIAELALGDDRTAKDVFRRFGEQLGSGLATTIGPLNPSIIALGGAISKSSVLFRDVTETAYYERAGNVAVFDWKQDASLALYGAAAYAKHKLE